jgi:hypothetical protein
VEMDRWWLGPSSYTLVCVLDGAGVLTTCNWLPKLFKNLKLDFLI